MNAVSPISLPFNPHVLRWSRDFAQLTVDEAAKKAGTSPENINAWEEGSLQPTVRQARLLAKAYERSFLEFFRKDPPPVQDLTVAPDFRLHRQIARPDENRELKKVQRWAESLRNSAIDLYDMLGEAPPALPGGLFATIEANPELVAKKLRDATGLGLDQQMDLPSAEVGALPKRIRDAIESIGILVLRHPALDDFGIRGVCLFKDPLPIIIFSSESPAAQCFTLAHELGHILLQITALSGPPADQTVSKEADIERWCNRLAGAFLVPSSVVAERWAKPNMPIRSIGDDELKQWARSFGISKHAMLIRLVDLGYVDPQFYWGTKRADFIREEEQFKAHGRAKYYGARYRSQNGDLFTSLVIEAWDRNLITNHNAAEFMGIKNLVHLNEIRENFSRA